MAGVHYLSVVVLAYWLQGVVRAINLDISTPLVKSSPGAASKDRFGYSVVLHHVTTPLEGDFESFRNSARIIVGAPHGTFPGGVPGLMGGMEERNTGLVYQCPVGPTDCDSVSGDGKSHDRRLFDRNSNTDHENKTGQLMGAVLYSDGNFFMACAPLYAVFGIPGARVIALDDNRPVGRCFLSGRDLQNFNLLMPCDGTTKGNDPKATADSEGHCLSGFSAAIINPDISDKVSVSMGAPGKNRETGEMYYYSVRDNNVTFVGNSSNREIGSAGLAAATGYITSNKELDIISGAPRTDGSLIYGAVRIRTQEDKTSSTPVIQLMGHQTGEQFGTALATADLNNDGYDELVVGAPIYTSPSILEAGRVYVYENLQGTLNNTPIILEGHSIQSRFGSSIVNLGDINGDSFDDIVIGAPYEDNNSKSNTSGTIYVYHGRGSESGLISRSPDLILKAKNITSQVPDLTVLRGFGFSLASRDIDGNLYNDLLVGAHLSGNAVLIRSFSLADVMVEVSTSVDQVQVDPIASSSSTFIVTVCASYSGLGLRNRSISTTLQIKENSSFSRIVFRQDDSDVEIFNSTFTFATSLKQTCTDVTALIKPIGQLSQIRNFLSPIQIIAEFSEPQRPQPEYSNGSPEPLVDLREIPLLSVGGNTSVEVTPFVACAGTTTIRQICMPDLIVSLNGLDFLNSSGLPYNDSFAVAGQFQSLRVDLNYSNIGVDPAVGAQILFDLPEGYSFQRAIDITINEDISCVEDISKARLYRCSLRSYIPPLRQSSEGAPFKGEIYLTWLYTGPAIVGNEPPQTSNISIELNSKDDQESNQSNNQLIGGPVTIRYTAVSNLEISAFLFRLTVRTYRHVAHVLVENPTIIELGRTVNLTFRGVNRGPSNSPSAIVDIFIPTNDTSTRFFLYLASATARQGSTDINSMCNFSGINPQGLEQGTTSSGPRRRRSALHRRQEDRAAADSQVSRDQVKNCSDPATRARGICTHLSCVIDNFVSSQVLEITVSAVLDDRYFMNESDPFVFIAYATLRGNVHDNMPSNNEMATPPYMVTLARTGTDNTLPIWIPILIAIIIAIIFILLFILLCWCGFYHHRKKQQEREKGAEYPLGPNVSLDAQEKEKDNLPGGDDKSEDITEDIGDTSDLQDNNDVRKTEETDETSI